ncbi:ankyrin repeat domain-containing protein [candidate division CSSED10-310 bacterium]|uniref:Ankyrin repeat domain-containing protein n=1 Tax=candidate division CSSED10-310 bacterium TaxID=2855610 RepID=A0ABV6YXK2_UNCC1
MIDSRSFYAWFFRSRLDQELLRGVKLGQTDQVATLIRKGARIETSDTLIIRFKGGDNRISGYRPLMWAARKGLIEIMDILLKAGAEVQARNEWSRTALMEAVAESQSLAASFLIEHGAQVNDCDYSGRTVLMQSLYSADPEMVKNIIEAGARLHEYTINIGTALNLAHSVGNKDMVRILEEAGAEMIDWDDLYEAPP